VLQGGTPKARLPGNVPCGQPLYALVDLLGSASAVSLVLGAAPPADLPPELLGVGSGGGPSGFNAQLLGPSVTVSQNGLYARHGGTRESLHGVVFGEGPLAEVEGAFYFEVQVEETCTGHEDGLTLGVTTQLPLATQPPYEVAAAVPHSWSLGYYGAAAIEGLPEWLPVAWSPASLRVGDRVGLHVFPGEELHIVVNDRVAVRLSCAVPRHTLLYPMVDLIGNTLAVSFNTAATPPRRPGQKAAGAVAPAPAAAAAPVAPAPQPAPPQEPLRPAPLRRLASAVDFSQLVVDERRQLSGFASHLLSSSVVLSTKGVLARRHDPSSGGLCGVVFSDVPIPQFTQGFYFEVRIEEVCHGNMDGLTLGVTPLLPKPAQLPFAVAEQVPLSWSLGYDGAAHIHGQEGMVDIDWNPAGLSVGDRVGLLVRQDGSLQILENGVVACTVATSVPTDAPLYAVVDLLGNTVAASLTVSAPLA